MISKIIHIMKRRHFLLIIVSFIIGSDCLFPQGLIDANPADLRHSNTLFVNPSVISFQNPYAVMGIRFFHIGLLEDDAYGLRHQSFGIAFPEIGVYDLGAGLSGQYFDTPIYDVGHFNLLVSRKILPNASVGIRLGTIMQSYNKDEFDLVDENDPVFASGTSKMALNVGLGFLYSPVSKLFIGLSVDHINQPNLSLIGDDIKQPLRADGGMAYDMGFIRPYIGFTYFREEFIPHFHLESYVVDWGSIRLGYMNRNLQMEGELYIIGGTSLNYCYDYPISDLSGVTGGTHMLSLIFHFKGGARLERMVLEKSGQPSTTSRKPVEVLIDSEVDTLNVVRKHIFRSFSPEITTEEIANLPVSLLGALDSTSNVTESLKPIPLEIAYQMPVEGFADSKNYTENLDSLCAILKRNKHLALNIIGSPNAVPQAQIIQKHIVDKSRISSDRIRFVSPVNVTSRDDLIHAEKIGPNPIPPNTHVTVLTPGVNRFLIQSNKMSRDTRDWKLVIRNSDGDIVKIIQGKDFLPEEIPWAWQADADVFQKPGNYFYRIKWRDSRGRLYQSRESTFWVRELHRRVSIEIGKQPIRVDRADQVFLYLNR